MKFEAEVFGKPPIISIAEIIPYKTERESPYLGFFSENFIDNLPICRNKSTEKMTKIAFPK